MAKTSQRRTRLLRIRLSDEEWEGIETRALEVGQGMSTLLRNLGLSFVPKVPRSRIEKEAIYHLARIGNNLNQLTRTANAVGRVDLSRRLDEVLRELFRVLRELA